MEKLHPSHKYTIIFFLILFLLIEFILWGLFGTRWWALEAPYSLNNGLVKEIIYTSINLAVCISGFIIYFIRNTYYIDNTSIKFAFKKKEYRFKDITYLNESYSNKNKDLVIYVEGIGLINLMMDKDKKLLSIIKERGNFYSDNEFRRRHPNVNIDNIK